MIQAAHLLQSRPGQRLQGAAAAQPLLGQLRRKIKHLARVRMRHPLRHQSRHQPGHRLTQTVRVRAEILLKRHDPILSEAGSPASPAQAAGQYRPPPAVHAAVRPLAGWRPARGVGEAAIDHGGKTVGGKPGGLAAYPTWPPTVRPSDGTIRSATELRSRCRVCRW
jgi:hypothetical protein